MYFCRIISVLLKPQWNFKCSYSNVTKRYQLIFVHSRKKTRELHLTNNFYFTEKETMCSTFDFFKEKEKGNIIAISQYN